MSPLEKKHLLPWHFSSRRRQHESTNDMDLQSPNCCTVPVHKGLIGPIWKFQHWVNPKRPPLIHISWDANEEPSTPLARISRSFSSHCSTKLLSCSIYSSTIPDETVLNSLQLQSAEFQGFESSLSFVVENIVVENKNVSLTQCLWCFWQSTRHDR